MNSKLEKLRNSSALICEPVNSFFDQLEQAVQVADLFKNVIRAKDGTETLNKIAKQDFGLVILELHSPKHDALSIIKHIKTSINILITYSDKDETLFKQIEQLGVKHFLSKPVLTEAAVEKIINACSMG